MLLPSNSQHKKMSSPSCPPFNSLLKRSFVNGLDSQVACKVFLPGEGAVGFAHEGAWACSVFGEEPVGLPAGATAMPVFSRARVGF